jgi:tRNA 2-thiouridine synthesizing protein A
MAEPSGTIPSPGSGDALLDCTGLLCPMPVVKVSAKLREMPEGGVLEVLADDQGVKADFPALCRGAGHEWLGHRQEGRVVRSFIRKGKRNG